MKRCFYIVMLGVLGFWINSGYAQVVTETPSEKVSIVKKVGQTVKDVKNSVTQSTVVTKTAAAIGSAKKSVSAYMQNVQQKIAEAKEKYQKYKEKVDKYKAEVDKYKAEYEKTKQKINELEQTAKDIKDTAKSVVDNAGAIATGFIENKTGLSLGGSKEGELEELSRGDNYSDGGEQELASDGGDEISGTYSNTGAGRRGGSRLVDMASSMPTRRSIGGGSDSYGGGSSGGGSSGGGSSGGSSSGGGSSGGGSSGGGSSGGGSSGGGSSGGGSSGGGSSGGSSPSSGESYISQGTSSSGASGGSKVSEENSSGTAKSATSAEDVAAVAKIAEKASENKNVATASKGEPKADSMPGGKELSITSTKEDSAGTAENIGSSVLSSENPGSEQVSETGNQSVSSAGGRSASGARTIAKKSAATGNKTISGSGNGTGSANHSSASIQSSGTSMGDSSISNASENSGQSNDFSAPAPFRSDNMTSTESDFGYRLKGEIVEEKELPKQEVKEGDIYKLKNKEGSYIRIKDIENKQLRWIKLPKEVEITADITEKKAAEITEAINKELAKEKEMTPKSEAAEEAEVKPSRAAFKTSAGYGYIHQTFSLAFADIYTGETDNKIYVINDRLARVCFGEEGYKGAIVNTNLAECYQKLNDFKRSANADIEDLQKKHNMPGMDSMKADSILKNAYMEDLAAQYIEALDLYNKSLDFKVNKISPLVTSQVTTNHDAAEVARKLNTLLGINENAQFQARVLSNKIKKIYFDYRIRTKDED